MTKYSNPQGRRTIWRLQPTRDRWLLSSYALWMELGLPGVQHTSTPVSAQRCASYSVCRWFGNTVSQLPKTDYQWSINPVKGAGLLTSSSHFYENTSTREQYVRFPGRDCEMPVIWKHSVKRLGPVADSEPETPIPDQVELSGGTHLWTVSINVYQANRFVH